MRAARTLSSIASCALFAACAGSLSACSLVKLSDEITQAHCDNDSDCEVLNNRTAASFDACELWQCSTTTSFCEFSALDNDHDGFTPHVTLVGKDELVCEAKPEKQDCDDDNSARKPGGKERCDDEDNDCDQHVDEGVLDTNVTASLAFAGGDGAGDLDYAIDPTSGKLAVAYAINRTPSVPGFSVIDNDLPSGGNTDELVLPPSDDPLVAVPDLYADGVGVAALGMGGFAVAMYDRNSTNKRVIAGRVDLTASEPQLLVDEDVRLHGLHCQATGEDQCAAATTPSTPDTLTPDISALDDEVLVSYVRTPADADPLCRAKGEAVASGPVLANLLSVTSDALVEQTEHAVKLGDSSALAAPALLAVPSPSPGKTFGWLVAYVDETGAITLKNVRSDGSDLSVSAALFSLSHTKHRYSGVRLALGPKTDAGQVVGLVFQRGCTVEARVGVVLFTASVASDGSAKLSVALGETLIGGAPNEKDANLAYSKQRESWAIAYRDSMGVRARVIDGAGALLGTEPYLLEADVTSGANTSKARFAPAVVPTLAAKGWFGTLVYTERSGAAANGFSAVTLATCGADN